jgi:hypothetical protein
MIDRSAFSLVVNDDVSKGTIRCVVEAIDEGRYRNAVPAHSRIVDRGVVPVPTLVCDEADMPPITFVDPMWNTDDGDDLIHPAFLADVMDDAPAIAMARSCLSTAWMPRSDKHRHHAVLLALAATSARDHPMIHDAVGASAPSPWGEASSYQAASIIGGSVHPTPTNEEIASFVPRLVSMTLISRNVGVGSKIVLMPHGYRLYRDALPDPMEILRVLSNAGRP